MPGIVDVKNDIQLGIANGSDITTANSNGGTGNTAMTVVPGSGNTVQSDTSVLYLPGDTMSMKLTSAGTNVAIAYLDLASQVTNANNPGATIEMYVDTIPATNVSLIRFYSDTAHTTNIGTVQITGVSGKLFYIDGGALSSGNAATGLVAATHYLLEFTWVAGVWLCNIYKKGSAVVFTSITITGGASYNVGGTRVGVGTAVAMSIHIGRIYLGHAGNMPRPDVLPQAVMQSQAVRMASTY